MKANPDKAMSAPGKSRQGWRRLLSLFLLLLVLAALAGAALAAGIVTIDWQVIAGAGGPASYKDNITLNDTLGQPVIGSSSNGAIDLQAGYWSGVPFTYKIHLPLVVR